MILEIDFKSNVPIYQQIRDQIVLGLATEELSYGEALPSVRQLAEDLAINHMTVNKAYQLLKQEGLIETDRQSGTKIVATPPSIDSLELESYQEQIKLIISEGLAKTGRSPEFVTWIQETLNTLTRKDSEAR